MHISTHAPDAADGFSLLHPDNDGVAHRQHGRPDRALQVDGVQGVGVKVRELAKGGLRAQERPRPPERKRQHQPLVQALGVRVGQHVVDNRPELRLSARSGASLALFLAIFCYVPLNVCHVLLIYVQCLLFSANTV